ncbi:MAG: hypothetical protein HFACDABA_02769 [Anaerolineales bacterium]|nr:hypothetical protein [Anaerolineales bacterium]
MTEPIIRIVIGLIALAVGWAIGFFDSNMRAEKKIREAEERAKFAEEKARKEAQRPIAEAKPAPAAPAPVNVSGVNLLRLWLDEKEAPRLDLDDQTVNTTPISEAHRRRLVTLLNVLRPWIEGKLSARPAPATPPPAPVAAAPSPAVASPGPVQKEDRPAAPLSMVAQINEILQERLAGGPSAERGIRLVESLEGGVTVICGSQKFNSVSEVTDPQIQSEIRSAIAAWEKKYTPGG